jgi:hypothetical protein
VQQATISDPLADRVLGVLVDFSRWLSAYGESSLDYQTFYAGRIGGFAKSLYYRNRRLGIAAVAPMVFCEAFIPSARKLFYRRVRFPIADAHFAMGFAFLYEATSDSSWVQRMLHFLKSLEETRCPGFREYCWGYPFDWVTVNNGTIRRQTPLITTTPYVYEAFLQAYQIDQEDKWIRTLESIVRHVVSDIKDFRTSETASACSYTPYDKGGEINAAAYRSFLLTSASKFLSNDAYWRIAERNLNFVLENQNDDGSWYYAVDGRDFVDHFHTCFVMKALAKIYSLTGHESCLKALSKGVSYYLANLFAADGLPRPFSKAPRLTVYKRELYDCAECINLSLLLRDLFPQLNQTLNTVVSGIIKDWVRPDGSFRARRLHFGWDNVPMHRWGQSQMFRSLAYYLAEAKRRSSREILGRC